MNNILLIEDQPTICIEVERAIKLVNADCHIISCDNIHRANNLIVGLIPDLIILDLTLSNSDPDKTIQSIPAFSACAPTVVLSGASIEYFSKCIRSGALAFMDKPTYLRRGYEAFFVNHLIGASIIWKKLHGY